MTLAWPGTYSKKSAVKKLYEIDATVVSMSVLIEGLPDDVSIRCIARVPFYLHPRLELVSRSWRAAVRSTELLKARQEVGSAEDLLCVCAFDPENMWQLYDPLRELWITLPVLPSKIRHLAHFGVVCSAGKLFVLGGGSDAVDPLTGDQDGSFATDEVWSYDPVLREWAARASMLVPRAMFACCALNGKIVVAGGFTSCQKSISQAEMYDPEKDVWIPIPDLHRTHNSACSGVVIKEKLHVLHRGLSTVQILDSVGSGWTIEDYGWPQGPMAVVHDALYVMSHGLIVRQEGKTRKVVVSASEFQKRIGFAMTGLGDEMYVIGGVIGPDRWNWDIKPVSDVDILTVGVISDYALADAIKVHMKGLVEPGIIGSKKGHSTHLMYFLKKRGCGVTLVDETGAAFHKDSIIAIRYGAKGKLFVSVGNDKLVKIWSAGS
ncbi:hypothetical protein SADUNF_Sadunf02G0042800 [Salix dunnii]|uniref:F-box domain-containing protein n=1 Tax=Salix dunnii TaxID=1413687 RepID=A0A835N669_9ROSI|nr:hypothetical protein SADUNF_Sadunf02G0042800 [Salix dunnii]